MTYEEICRCLTEAGVEDAATDARLLLECFCHVGGAAIRADRTRDYTAPELLAAVRRRAARVPLQYLLGTWQFCRETYEVNASCLIPRPDTELLVEYAVRSLPRGVRFADLCTGSGCIAVSVLAARPDTVCDALELYPDTLSLATRNAKRNGVGERFCPQLADVLRGEGASGEYDAILSNPPYIPSRTVDTLSPEVLHEPRAALDGGEDGMRFYRAILANYSRYLRPGGQILFEIGYDEGGDIRALAKEYGFSAQVLRDLGGNERLAVLTR